MDVELKKITEIKTRLNRKFFGEDKKGEQGVGNYNHLM